MARSSAVFLLAMIAGACGSSSSTSAPASDPTHALPPPSSDTATRVRNVEAGLVFTDGEEKAHGTIASRMDALHVPAVSVALIDHYEVVWTRAYGVLDSSTKNNADGHTVFRACSLAKVVNALVTLKLVEDGDIGLDEDVNQALTSWHVPPNNFPEKPTVRRILNHTAGFNVHGFGRGYNVTAKTPLPSLADVLSGKPPAYNDPVEVTSNPGSEFSYSGGGTTVLEQLLVDVKKEKYQDLAQEIVLGPLAMVNSTFEEPLSAIWIDRAARGHDDQGEVLGGWDRAYPTHAASGLWTTAGDLALVVIEIERAYVGKPTKVISQATVHDVMFHDDAASAPTPVGKAPDTIPESTARVPTEGDARAGLGIFMAKMRGHLAFVHEGAQSGYASYLVGYPDLGIGAVILTNSDAGTDLIHELIEAIANEYRWP